VYVRVSDIAVRNEANGYLAVEQAVEGERSFSYPQPAQTGSSPVSNPDESLDITGFGLNGNFTLYIAGMTPWDDWSHNWARAGHDNFWPLFTLWSDATNEYIEFGARATPLVPQPPPNPAIPPKGAFRVNFRASGALGSFEWPRSAISPFPVQDDLYWSRHTQLLLAMSYDGSHLDFAGSVGGDVPRTSENLRLALTFASGFNFNRIAFRGASGEVVSFRWFGGQGKTGADDFGTIRQRLADLTFLLA
jgi:hypothetical protein